MMTNELSVQIESNSLGGGLLNAATSGPPLTTALQVPLPVKSPLVSEPEMTESTNASFL
jgi:hypothetical protein